MSSDDEKTERMAGGAVIPKMQAFRHRTIDAAPVPNLQPLSPDNASSLTGTQPILQTELLQDRSANPGNNVEPLKKDERE